MTSGARSRYLSSKAGVCSVKFLSDCGRPASTMATFRPASESRFAAHPPEAPQPTTSTSKDFFSSRMRLPLLACASHSSLLHAAKNTVVLIRRDFLRAQRQRHVSGNGVRPFDAYEPQAPGRSVDLDVEGHLHGKRIGHLRLGERHVQDGLALAAVLEVVTEVVMRSFCP